MEPMEAAFAVQYVQFLLFPEDPRSTPRSLVLSPAHVVPLRSQGRWPESRAGFAGTEALGFMPRAVTKSDLT